MSNDVPTSRTYVHAACEMPTEISESDFEAIADPICPSSHTMCAECEESFPMEEFAWSDTGERIVDYYDRYMQRVGTLGRMVGSRGTGIALAVLGLAGGASLGFVAAASIGWIGGVLVGLVCATIFGSAGLLVWDAVLKPAIVRRALGVDDCRMLK
jgi:hypothetical protein